MQLFSFNKKETKNNDIISQISMFIVSCSIPSLHQLRNKLLGISALLSKGVKWNGHSLSHTHFKTRLGRLTFLEPRNPLSKWKRACTVFTAFVKSVSNQLSGIDFFTPAYLLPKGRLLKGWNMKKCKTPQKNFLFLIIIVSKSKVTLFVK